MASGVAQGVRTAAAAFRAWLCSEGGPMPKDKKLLDISPIWNASMGAKAPGDKGYMARVTRGSMLSSCGLRQPDWGWFLVE